MMIKEWTDADVRTDVEAERDGGRGKMCHSHGQQDGRRMDGVLPMNGIPHGKG